MLSCTQRRKVILRKDNLISFNGVFTALCQSSPTKRDLHLRIYCRCHLDFRCLRGTLVKKYFCLSKNVVLNQFPKHNRGRNHLCLKMCVGTWLYYRHIIKKHLIADTIAVI